MKYSVITINYNNLAGLRRTIESVVQQTYEDYEYIIIDGGSTDGSVGIIKEYINDIDFWVSEKDRGIYHAMNKGVAQAHGDYCIFMNSGDVFYNEYVLQTMLDNLSNDDIVVGRMLNSLTGSVMFLPPQKEISLYYLYSSTVTHQSSFIKTDLLRRFPYDEKLKIAADWKFFLQSIIFQDCSVKFVPQDVAYFDMNGISTTNPNDAWNEKTAVLETFFPRRLLLDYKFMKESECLTQTLTPKLRLNYRIDKILFYVGSALIKMLGGK